jgi:hypothetical protein
MSSLARTLLLFQSALVGSLNPRPDRVSVAQKHPDALRQFYCPLGETGRRFSSNNGSMIVH